MTSGDKSSGPGDDNAVGYGRPPKESRFQPGTSGNPKGRPKRNKTLRDSMFEELMRPIPVVNRATGQIEGSVPAMQVITGQLVADAINKNDLAAIRILFSIFKDMPDPLSSQEQPEAEGDNNEAE